MSTVTANAPTIEIKGAAYAVEAMAPGFAGTAAVRLVKLVNGESYAVVRRADGLVSCECPDFVCRHADKGTRCKHGRAALEHGLLVAPAAPVAGVRPAAPVAPVTSQDLPIAVAPAAVAELAPEIETGNVRDSWPEWVDADVWTTEAAPDDFRPTAGPDFTPTDEDLMEAAGFALGLDGEPCPDIADLSIPTALYLAAARGYVAGHGQRAYALEMERLEAIDADHDEIMGRDARFSEWVREMERRHGLDGSEPREGDGFGPGYYT